MRTLHNGMTKLAFPCKGRATTTTVTGAPVRILSKSRNGEYTWVQMFDGSVSRILSSLLNSTEEAYICDWCGKEVLQETDLTGADYDSGAGVYGSMICAECMGSLRRRESTEPEPVKGDHVHEEAKP